MNDVPVPDVFDPRQYARGIPHDRYRHLRDHHPVAWQEEPEVLGWPAGPGFWAVTRHEDAVRVLKDFSTYSSHLGATQIRDPDPEDLPFIRRMVLNQDPPHHRRLRTLVSRAFTPKRVDRFETAVRERARSLLTRALAEAQATDGTCDLVTQVTDDYALLNLTDLLGVPDTDRRLLLHWTQRVIGYQDPDEAGTPVLGPDGKPVNPRSPAALRDMFDYVHELAAHKRRHPGDDVMTALATDPELTAPELEMFFFILVVAGNDTVRSAAPAACTSWPNTLRRTAACATARSNSPPPSTNSSAATHRSSPSAAPRRRTRTWRARVSAVATRWWSSTPRPTTTNASSATRSPWTFPGPRTHTSRSETAPMSAWARTSPAWNYGFCTRRRAAFFRRVHSNSRARRAAWCRTSSTV